MIDSNPLLDGVTFSGGEPFLQAGVFAEFATECRRRGLSVMTYTGYHYEELVAQTDRPDRQELLRQTDILVDGPFLREQATPDLPFRGSANQRLLEI